MPKKRIVVALGRNAFGKTLPEQKTAVKEAAKAIADLAELKYQIVITHSNGPQVGMIHMAMTEFGNAHQDFTVAPMAVCSAMSQGYIGYDLQNEIRTELLRRGIFNTVSTIITQVKVDPFDHAFSHPLKSIGRIMTAEQAQAERDKGNFVREEEGGFRRIVASPAPIEIYEIDAIRALADAGQVVIAAGGGGIAVLEQGPVLKGASAVIEKDATAAKMAHELDADVLLFLSATERFVIHADTPQEFSPDHLSVAEAMELIDSQTMAKETKLPKLASAVSFVAAGENRKAIITSLDKVKEALAGKTGTLITKLFDLHHHKLQRGHVQNDMTSFLLFIIIRSKQSETFLHFQGSLLHKQNHFLRFLYGMLSVPDSNCHMYGNTLLANQFQLRCWMLDHTD